MALPTAFTAGVFDKVDKLADKFESQEVKDIVEVIDAAAREAEPLLKMSRRRRTQHHRRGQECRQ